MIRVSAASKNFLRKVTSGQITGKKATQLIRYREKNKFSIELIDS
jgi:hypothetical protein